MYPSHRDRDAQSVRTTLPSVLKYFLLCEFFYGPRDGEGSVVVVGDLWTGTWESGGYPSPWWTAGGRVGMWFLASSFVPVDIQPEGVWETSRGSTSVDLIKPPAVQRTVQTDETREVWVYREGPTGR